MSAVSVSVTTELGEARLSHPELAALQHFLHAIPAAAYICAADGRVTLYNEAAVALWGRMPVTGDDQWCGSYKMHWPDGTSMPLSQCPMAIALKTSRSLWGMDAVIERPDGTRRDVIANPQLLHDSTGSVFGALNILVDITERKQNDEASGRLAAIVESSDDAIVGKTLEGIITSWNRSAERIFGYTAAEAVGQHMRRAEEDYVLAQVQR
ncbi:MAG: PAS domain S-box protein, partial [Bryobacteraceae bacterium]